jgi:hypothetical protein
MEDVIDKIPQLTEEKKEGGREERKRTGSKASRRTVKFKQDPNCGKHIPRSPYDPFEQFPASEHLHDDVEVLLALIQALHANDVGVIHQFQN